MKMRMMCLIGGVVVAAVLVGSLGVASATVLCKTKTDPCTSKYAAGTEIKFELAVGSKWVLKAGFATVECGKASLVEKTEGAGGAGLSVTASVSTRDFSECGSCEVKSLKSGTTHYEKIAGSFDLTVTESGMEVTANCSGVSCVYGGAAAVDVGEYTAADFKLDEHESAPKVSGGFLCANPASLTATYKLTSPETMYGAES